MKNNKNKFKPGSDKNKSSKGKYKGKGKPFIKKEDEMSEDKQGKHVSQAVNDESYYIPSGGEILYEQTLNYSFNEFLGVPVDLYQYGANKGRLFVPAFARYAISPSAGWTDDTALNSAGVNKLGLQNYLALSAGNAKTTKYQPQDVTTLILGFGQLIAMISWGTRAFGLYFTFNQRNKSVPNDAIECSGFDFNDFKANYNQYRIDFNTIINAANKIPIPADIEYFKKCNEIYAGVYLDEPDSPMAQAYMFAPASTWLFDEAYSPNGTGLRTIKLLEDPNTTSPDYTLTFAQYLTILDSMVTALATSTTLNDIYSDVKRLQENKGVKMYTFGMVGEDYRVTPNYVPELEMWIMNARVIGSPQPTASQFGTGYTNENDVVPDAGKNCVRYRPQFLLHAPEFQDGQLINFKKEAPSRAERCYATRLMASFKSVYDSGSLSWFSTECALADFYLMGVVMYDGVRTTGNHLTISRSVEPVTAWSILTNLEAFNALTKFDWHPRIFAYDPAAVNNEYYRGVLGDLQYYTLLPHRALRAIDDVTITGLLEV